MNKNTNAINGLVKREEPVNTQLLTFENYKSSQVLNVLDKFQLQFQNSMSSYLKNILNTDAAMQLALNLIQKNNLYDCSQISIINGIKQALSYGFPPGYNDLFYLIPFKNRKTGIKEATFMISYKGLESLLYRTGQYNDLYSCIVYEGDIFEYELGLNKRLYHKPIINSLKRNIICAYAVLVMKNGYKKFEVIDNEYINKIKEKALEKAYDKQNSLWNTDFIEMIKKTALKYICKTANIYELSKTANVELNAAIKQDDDEITDIELTTELIENITDEMPFDKELSKKLELEDEGV